MDQRIARKQKPLLREAAARDFAEATNVAEANGLHVTKFSDIHYRIERPCQWAIECYPTTRRVCPTMITGSRRFPDQPPDLQWKTEWSLVDYLWQIIRNSSRRRVRAYPSASRSRKPDRKSLNERRADDPRFRQLCNRCQKNFGEKQLGGLCDECHCYVQAK